MSPDNVDISFTRIQWITQTRHALKRYIEYSEMESPVAGKERNEVVHEMEQYLLKQIAHEEHHALHTCRHWAPGGSNAHPSS